MHFLTILIYFEIPSLNLKPLCNMPFMNRIWRLQPFK